ncbi:hypothetical protein AA13595_1711 [Gluconacetobacter johannae DSM 13595]|uniref:FkbM family methyltransferase n=1 Tax=Gluconacetobacter johannae TaxID=112140 RepID=A0A7W4P3K3_9PROT|nr:FkbM family methyltransferase [Gluconacetobacter johannae]MBB2176112.1 FkbM family methyltransferase [Gluconacetobacter johannae]GBQ85691.1 hypothetical protein AA13595_1711 [Gluconacetobacter johannae DSM 13595]
MTALPSSARDILNEDAGRVAARLTADQLARLSGRHVLITGAAGFLPGAIVDTIAYLNTHGLVEKPVRLTLLGRSAEALRRRHPWAAEDPGVTALIQDVSLPLPPLAPVDYIIHAASPAAPRSFMADPAGLMAANTTGLMHLLARARQDRAAALLYVSSSEVYGTLPPEQFPTSEDAIGLLDWRQARTAYAEAKRAGEAISLAWWRQHNVPVRIVRPFHVHGPGQDIDDGRIVGAMVRLGLDGRPFVLESDGQATRTYGYVTDATTAFLKILLSGADGGLYGIGADGPETSILDLATEIARLFGVTEPVRTASARPQAGSPSRVRPNLDRIRTELGCIAEVGLSEGLARTIAWNRAVAAEAPAVGHGPERWQRIPPLPQAVPAIPDLMEAYAHGRMPRDSFWKSMARHHQGLDDTHILVRDAVAGMTVTGEGATITLTNGLRLGLNAGDIRGAAAHVLNHGHYEPTELAAFQATLATTRGRFVDIGANVGWYSLHASLHAETRTAGILAVEPVPDTRMLLCANLARNGLETVVKVAGCALGEASDTITLHVPEFTGSVAASRRPLFPDQPNRRVTVPQRTLDSLLTESTNGSAVGLVKIDVEGAEIFVLRGAGATLERHRPVLMMELLRKWAAVYDYHPNDILDLLAPLGYVAHALTANGLEEISRITDETVATNFLFLVPDRHSAVAAAVSTALRTLPEDNRP